MDSGWIGDGWLMVVVVKKVKKKKMMIMDGRWEKDCLTAWA